VILVVVVALAALSVPLLGGSLTRLGTIRLRGTPMLAAALALQILIISVVPAGLPEWSAQTLHLISYGLAAGFVVVNRRVPWLWLVGLGGLANLVAIGANAGVMPASLRALRAAGRLGHRAGFVNSGYRAGAHLRDLGDVFALPRQWPLANVFSVGDIGLAVGAFLLLHSVGASRLVPGRRRAAQRERARIRAMAPAGIATQPGR
jgi:hypothetical protein